MNFILYTILIINGFLCCDANKTRTFPKGFIFGVASASYQIEGAWNVSDKSENIWDHLTHNRKDLILDGSNGDDAVKSYEFYMRDIEALKELGVDFYRFSISWSRLLPTGFANKISKDGLKYYNSLIDELLKNGIKPVVTIYHWDLPQRFQDLGGWTNPIMADYFREYAKVCFREFGDRVKLWLTINEPRNICLEGYGGVEKAPALFFHGIADYLCGATLLRGHAMAYRVYDKEFRSIQKGRVGLTLSTGYDLPAVQNENTTLISNIIRAFELGWWTDPIFSKNGDYPEIMKEMVANKSKEQGYPFSRLPELSKDDIEMIRNSSDFLGINHYSTYLITDEKLYGDKVKIPSIYDDHGISGFQNESWPGSASPWLKSVPQGFRGLLKDLKEAYDNPEIMVFENGFSTVDGSLNDTDRVNYIKDYMNAMLDAIEIDKVNVTAYTVWCLTDNFEWNAGYTQLFGIYSTNFSDPNRSITAKESAKFYAQVVKTKEIDAVD